MKALSSKVQWAAATGLVIVAVGALAGYALLRSRAVPDGQRPLLSLSGGDLDELKQAFNAGVDHPRIIAFLSPT